MADSATQYLTLALLLAITGALGYALVLLRHIAYQADLLVNVVIPWMNHIGQVVIPNYQQIPEPPIKG